MKPNRPVRNQLAPRRAPVWRVPERGYVIPRLRDDDQTEAIGFVHRFEPEAGEDE
jgi:hypothetical protein